MLTLVCDNSRQNVGLVMVSTTSSDRSDTPTKIHLDLDPASDKNRVKRQTHAERLRKIGEENKWCPSGYS
jgi:hypothetical protein